MDISVTTDRVVGVIVGVVGFVIVVTGVIVVVIVVIALVVIVRTVIVSVTAASMIGVIVIFVASLLCLLFLL